VTRVPLRMGIDIGSTTAKAAILGPNNDLRFTTYQRHKAKIDETLLNMLEGAHKVLGDIQVDILVTGSAGMGVTEQYALPFIQEVVASAEVVNQLYPEVRTLIDIGGEDAKMIFFGSNGIPDIRMNGSCAGGTGAFIDEMATLLDISVFELNNLAEQHSTIYPMASRCGVFAKTDVQNLLSREIPREDIAASVFHALVYQTLATLSRGYAPAPQFIFSGGPLTFLPALKTAFLEALQITTDCVLDAENTELLPAIGAALADKSDRQGFFLTELIERLNRSNHQSRQGQRRLDSLFKDSFELENWEENRTRKRTRRVDIHQVQGSDCFLGIDSGSTTTKLVLIDEIGRVIFDYYANNKGNSIKATQIGLTQLQSLFSELDQPPRIVRTMVTGYGEDLIRTAFGFDGGMVETLAHFRGAKAFDADVSFILDIGGQDMKAIFVRDGQIQNIEINEACSSGCGSFIEAFASSMEYDVSEFSRMACVAENPCDMGSRCTVFMNSRVKQALREAAKVEDISAGLAYSVIKNALHKVLKITDTSILGDHIVVQGGTFLNPAVHRAMENLLGKPVLYPDIAELMGAYGASLTARDSYQNNGAASSSCWEFTNIEAAGDYQKRLIHCGGCENRCTVTKLIFQNQNFFYTGNRCERIYTNRGEKKRLGISLPEFKYQLLFDREYNPKGVPLLTLGIPRVLNMFENFPFWNTLFTECGLKVHLSNPSSSDLYEKGAGTVMSENICFPAKLVHGHIFDLIEAGVDRIFLPMVFYENKEFSDAANHYNCPIVSGYADVVRSSIDPEGKYGIPLDQPTVTFGDLGLLKKACVQYLAGLGVKRRVIYGAFEHALAVQKLFKQKVRHFAYQILDQARAEDRPVILMMGHPYHLDPHINHKIPDILTSLGVDIITEDAVPVEPGSTLRNTHLLTQWEYINRYLFAARWAAEQEDVGVVQLNSFACAPDAISIDEAKSTLAAYGKGLTVVRIDEIESTGSAKLRLRSMVEAMNIHLASDDRVHTPRKTVKIYDESDRNKKILAVHFSHFNDPTVSGPLKDLGYRIERLPPPDSESVELGLKYCNNEVCYPGIIIIGDIIKALKSGKYDLSEIAVGSFATGGQCRASCYPSIFKRALISAGHEDIPIVALTTSKKLYKQPGFDLNYRQYIYKAIMSAVYTDAISDMYYATACREVNSGDALALTNKHFASLYEGSLPLNQTSILETLEDVVSDFNAIETVDQDLPKVGIVGEIYVKYNDFSNNHVAQWLMDHGHEVIVPSLLEFFLGWFVSPGVHIKSNIKRRSFVWMLTRILEPYTKAFLDKSGEVLNQFRYHRTHHSIQEIAANAKRIMSLSHQYGEGWLIAGEIGTMIGDGINNVLCLQPFGCIANQVVAKGVAKRMAEKFHNLNLLFLDLDAGVSEVNFFNRMHFFIERARQSFQNNKLLRA
jgi:predicted CoA-substrate-specific enzyme activase